MDFIFFINKFFDFSSHRIHIGGVETYIKDLASLTIKMGYNPIIYQRSDTVEESTVFDGIKIISKKYIGKTRQKIFNDIIASHANAIVVISTDQLDIKTSYPKAIQIQHGIAFDIPGNMIKGFWGKTTFLQNTNKLLRCLKNTKRLRNVPNTVCVDYNFYNWYRTIGSIPNTSHIKVIPNYSSSAISEEELNDKLKNRKGPKKIIFARRFVDYRGTLLFANVVRRILNIYDVEVTFAGSGPLEDYLITTFKDNPKVQVTSFKTGDSVSFHKKYDIAVIPTIFSEGTSLSLCEAMSAGCIPIATHVGGMTNIILDSYNGFLTYPSEQEVYEALKMVIELPAKEFNSIASKAYGTATKTFSRSHWEKGWTDFIQQINEI